MPDAPRLINGAQAIVFDLDGTLVDTLDDLWRGLNTALEQQELPPAARELVLANIHLGLEGTARAALSHSGIDASRIAAAVDTYQRAYRNREHAGSVLYPGVRDFLDSCARHGQAMAVCTNKATDDARTLLTLLKIADFFPVVTGIDACGLAKPHPAPLNLTLEQLGRAPGEAVFIGDSVIDAQCATSAGVAFLLHESGYGAHDALAFGCQGRFHSYGELFIPSPSRFHISNR
jgi:phosphoglycolate phosphatase